MKLLYCGILHTLWRTIRVRGFIHLRIVGISVFYNHDSVFFHLQSVNLWNCPVGSKLGTNVNKWQCVRVSWHVIVVQKIQSDCSNNIQYFCHIFCPSITCHDAITHVAFDYGGDLISIIHSFIDWSVTHYVLRNIAIFCCHFVHVGLCVYR